MSRLSSMTRHEEHAESGQHGRPMTPESTAVREGVMDKRIAGHSFRPYWHKETDASVKSPSEQTARALATSLCGRSCDGSAIAVISCVHFHDPEAQRHGWMRGHVSGRRTMDSVIQYSTLFLRRSVRLHANPPNSLG